MVENRLRAGPPDPEPVHDFRRAALLYGASERFEGMPEEAELVLDMTEVIRHSHAKERRKPTLVLKFEQVQSRIIIRTRRMRTKGRSPLAAAAGIDQPLQIRFEALCGIRRLRQQIIPLANVLRKVVSFRYGFAKWSPAQRFHAGAAARHQLPLPFPNGEQAVGRMVMTGARFQPGLPVISGSRLKLFSAASLGSDAPTIAAAVAKKSVRQMVSSVREPACTLPG
ncbi:MAG: hypothetical protein R2724_05435 [Bryobacterales bacterium]